jgi:histidinol-phosphate/aromatic aminotransferase/cobyric acid decarboxylase-like protein
MIDSVTKNRYGWSQKLELIASVVDYNKVSNTNIMLGSGSTEILNLILQHTA